MIRVGKHYRLAFDIGGTFTDLVLLDETTGAISIGKTLTTPRDPAVGVMNGVEELFEARRVAPEEADRPVTGATTLVTNTVIERNGAKTGLVTTRGFADVLEIGREWRYDIYDLFLEMPEPLVPRDQRLEVNERIEASGKVLAPLDESEMAEVLHRIREMGIESLAICFLHSYRNPANERAAGDLARRLLPHVPVTLSSELIPEIREFERTSATVANAYVQPRVYEHFDTLVGEMRRRGLSGQLYMMQSNGGILPAERAASFPIKLLESGPAAGALAAAFYGGLAELDHLLSFDMGGTTAKACIVDWGRPQMTTDFEAARVQRFKKGSGLAIRIPVIDLIEIGAGGGSIARVDAMGLLKVGPASQSADPGPACYGRGGALPTVTDADLLLGYLDPGFFLGGKMALDREAAEASILRYIAEPLGLSVVQAASGIHRVVNQSMATAAKVHLAEHGKDPRAYTLLAFGGAGPVHAREVARALKLPGFVVPLGAGATSAIGLLLAPATMDFVHSYLARLEMVDWEELARLDTEMCARGISALCDAGILEADIRVQRSADMRYVGQGYEIQVPLDLDKLDPTAAPRLRDSFLRTYEQLFGRSLAQIPVELVSWRVVVVGPQQRVELRSMATDAADLADAYKGRRPVYFPEVGGYVEGDVYAHDRLTPGARFEGPAIVEQREATMVIGPNEVATVGDYLTVRVTLPAQNEAQPDGPANAR